MKLIFSRKGFDAGFGGMASPILPDGRLVPLTIPSQHDRYTFADLHMLRVDLGALLADLSKGRITTATQTHLDPDLDRRPRDRLRGWRPSLGQIGSAQSHLQRRNVGPGDLFLFFGWFREVEHCRNGWRFHPEAPNIHLLFGWLEIEEVLSVSTDRQVCLRRHPWIADHPHVRFHRHYQDERNTLYIGARESRHSKKARFGGGRFPEYSPQLQLTAPGATRSVWSLPAWMMPVSPEHALSYHSKPERWRQNGDSVLLQTVAKGQEFVLDCDQYPAAAKWAASLVKRHA